MKLAYHFLVSSLRPCFSVFVPCFPSPHPSTRVLSSVCPPKCRSLLGSSGLGQSLETLAALELGVLDDSGISIAREVAGPLDEGGVLELAAGDCVGADSAHHRAVGELWLGGDDGVGDVVVDGLGYVSAGHWKASMYGSTHAVFLLLDLNDSAILESPLDNVGVWGGALDLEGTMGD